MSEIEQLLQLEDLLHDSTTVAYNTVSATSLVLYEIIVTFPDELQLIWQSPWSLVTVVYLLTRYFALIFLIICSYVTINTHLSAEFCGPFLSFQTWGPSVLVPAVDILIMLRIYALYNQNKWIRGVLGFFWLVETTIILSLTGLGFGPNKGATPNPLPGILPECFPNDPFNVHNLVLGGSIAIGFQAIYLGLALYKLVQQYKISRLFTPLLETFFRDGALYCFNILATYILVAVFAQTNDAGTPLQGVGAIWLVAIVSITAGRLVLNLRSVRLHTNTSNNNSDPTDQSGSYELRMRGAGRYNAKVGNSQMPPIVEIYQVPKFQGLQV